jgi:hypothetical protein
MLAFADDAALAPSPTARRALELLAASRDGCTEALMLAHGFTVRREHGQSHS